MQEGLAHLELEAREVRHDRMSSTSSISSPTQGQHRDSQVSIHGTSSHLQPQQSQPQASAPRGYTANYAHTNAEIYQNVQNMAPNQAQTKAADKALPSPFPKLRGVGPNVPPSMDEKETVLDTARPTVLNSKDAEMQLAWAQDALLWVEIAAQNRTRLAEDEAARPGTPKVEHQLRVDAVSIINFLAEQHHPKALFLKATWYEFGKFGYPLDRKEAFQGYRKAAEKGYARAEYRIGTQYESLQDMGKAIKHYSVGVTMGDSASNYRMGMMALLGQHGQQQDYELGIRRIRFAADTADENAPQGAYVYGMLLARELPNITVPETILPVDIYLAKQFIEKAAFLGFAKAQLKMGAAYELCLLGCDFNPALSLHYNALAAQQGEAEADMAISKWFLCGYEDVFDKNDELAFTYAKRAAQSGLPTAEFALGYFHEIGMYVASDLRQAQSWYQKAADHGNKDAVGRLESLSQQKTLSKKDHEQIAITRIKSQYGSQRGKRPERFKDKPAPLPAMVEEPIDMPDPNAARNMISSPVAGFMVVPPDYSQSPARPKSTAPYPEDDVAPQNFSVRTSSRPSSSHGNNQLRPLTGPTADRPQSAFGIRPLHVQNQDYPGHGYIATSTLRPATSMGNMAVPEGRGSDPAGRHRVVSAGWEPTPLSTYRQPSPGRQPIPPSEPIHQQQPQQPLDQSHSGRNKLQKQGPNTGKPQPAIPQFNPPNPGYPVTPQITPVIPHRATPMSPPGTQSRYDQPSNSSAAYNNQMQHTSYDARASLPSNSAQRPERIDSMQPSASRPRPPPSQGLPASPAPARPFSATPSSSSTLPPRTSSVSTLPPRTSSATPSSASVVSTQSKPTKEGPKTFDEMGIPSQKNESDCVRLTFLPSDNRVDTDAKF